jgi:TorA maturation chaperone TorD
MAKRINLDEIDESLIVAAVRKDRTQQEIVPPPLAPLPATAHNQAEQSNEASVTASEQSKEEVKRKRNKQDYEALFIIESTITARLGKSVYVRREYHDRIQKIVQVIGKNEVSLFSYIDNIIAHHFDMFQDDIIRLYNQKNSNIF